ncbi:hypothetical protein AGOR_G00076630 [Albula goreensis]|uniref:B30.2/SPRY domain-containing protein n=1 Tax=Albula goreensis TaxID=1534307 RepID=A0A8T3DSS0_9TELE|nr:hypothetical protein AGOR_G00076630 [Albula goreensis]
MLKTNFRNTKVRTDRFKNLYRRIQTEAMQPVHHHSWSPELRDVETVEASQSEPWNKPKLSAQKPTLQALHTLEECIQLITDLAKEVETINKHGRKKGFMEKNAGALGNPSAQHSLEDSRDLILQWAEELDNLAQLSKLTEKIKQKTAAKRQKTAADTEKDKQRILDWARELQSVSASCDLSDEELKQILSLRCLGNKKLSSVLPLLEFVAWSLLTGNTEEDVSKLWLSAKQKIWKAGTPRYIPNSVWQWIHNASVKVDMDPSTIHPWLVLTEKNQQLQEGSMERNLPVSPQTFDKRPCVLGTQGFTTGRHYWEVEVSAKGSWRLGVANVSAPRKGRFKMSPAQGYWMLWRSDKTLRACTESETKLQDIPQLKFVGIYLDYQEGQVSFYNAENKSHIYTFSDTFQEMVYPVFACLDGDTTLKIKKPDISPVSVSPNVA